MALRAHKMGAKEVPTWPVRSDLTINRGPAPVALQAGPPRALGHACAQVGPHSIDYLAAALAEVTHHPRHATAQLTICLHAADVDDGAALRHVLDSLLRQTKHGNDVGVEGALQTVPGDLSPLLLQQQGPQRHSETGAATVGRLQPETPKRHHECCRRTAAGGTPGLVPAKRRGSRDCSAPAQAAWHTRVYGA